MRFAPSPTGFLHIGGARTALYNWLFARKHGGTFLLRIEDTDELRSTDEATSQIFEGLRWLGLVWDEGPQVGGGHGPYFQMERTERGIYREYADRLLAEGKAYLCYCTPEELAARRQQALAEGRRPGYDGRCRGLSEAQRRAAEAEGRRPSVRFRVEDGPSVLVEDVVRGTVRFERSELDDFVIQKSSGGPAFLFANVVDDHLMEITHVIRGEDHLSNTPRQILLYEALGWDPPVFAHLSLLYGPDGKKLSKRHGAVAVSEYERQGYLPEAMVNYLALLGWSTADSQQLFSGVEEIIEKFELERVSKNPAVFDVEKLRWVNEQYIRRLDRPGLLERARPFLRAAGFSWEDDGWAADVLWALRERVSTLGDLPEASAYFFRNEIEYDQKAWEKVMTKEGVPSILERLRGVLAGCTDFSVEGVERAVRGLIAELGVKGGVVIHPLRVAVTGRSVGPGVFECVSLVGKERALERIGKALEILRQGQEKA